MFIDGATQQGIGHMAQGVEGDVTLKERLLIKDL